MKKLRILMTGCMLAATMCLFAACGNGNNRTTTPDTNAVQDNNAAGTTNGGVTNGTTNNGDTNGTTNGTVNNDTVNGTDANTADTNNNVGNDVNDLGDDVGNIGRDVVNGVEDAGGAIVDGVEDITGTNNGTNTTGGVSGNAPGTTGAR